MGFTAVRGMRLTARLLAVAILLLAVRPTMPTAVRISCRLRWHGWQCWQRSG